MQPVDMPSLSIDVALVAQYSVAFAVAVNVVGFIIAASYYARSGVHPALLPLKVVWGAGLSFLVLTSYFAHVGYVGGRVMFFQPGSTSGEGWYLFLAIILMGVLRRAALVRAGAVLYLFPCVVLGGLVRVGWVAVPPMPQMTAAAFRLPLPAFVFILGLAPVIAYAYVVYPNLVREFGGAAYQPVIITLNGDANGMVPPGTRVYEVFTTSDSIYLAVETIKPHDAPPPVPTGAYTKRNWHQLLSRRYLQLPRSAVTCLEYTDPLNVAPPAAGTVVADTLMIDATKPNSELGRVQDSPPAAGA